MSVRLLDRQLRAKSFSFTLLPWVPWKVFLSSLFLVKVSLLGYYGWSLLRDSLSARHLGKETNSFSSTNDVLGWLFRCGISGSIKETWV